MVSKLKSRLKKLLSTLLIILGLWTIASTAVVAFPPDLREQVKVFTVSGAIELLAEKVDDLTGRVSRLELETARDRACGLADELNTVPPDYEGTRIASITVQRNIELLEQMDAMPGDPGYEGIQKSLSYFRDRLNKYLTAKEECDRLTEEYQEKYGE